MVTKVIRPEDIGQTLKIAADKLEVNVGATLTVDTTTGEVNVNLNALSIVSPDTGNLLSADANGAVFFNQAALQSAETVWAGLSGSGALQITPGGTNNHAPTFTLDLTHPEFVEAAQDAFGAAVVDAADGLDYDDLNNKIVSSLGNLTFGNGLTSSGLTAVAVLADPNSPSVVTVSPQGVRVIPGISTDADNLATLGTDQKVFVGSGAVTALATIELCGLDGTPICKAFPV